MTRSSDRIMRTTNAALRRTRYRLARATDLVDVQLHEYPSYEAYREAQIRYNAKKLDKVWADARTLDEVARIVRGHRGEGPITGICHGARNGFEQGYLSDNHSDFDVIGTDIAPTATQFPRSVVWDFHDARDDWIGKFDFVYSNSLDQAWQPRAALTTWLNQIGPNGVVIVEHTHGHGPGYAGEMDPFGVRPTAFPYVMADWFGHQISVAFWRGEKSGPTRWPDVWLFVLRRNVPEVS